MFKEIIFLQLISSWDYSNKISILRIINLHKYTRRQKFVEQTVISRSVDISCREKGRLQTLIQLRPRFVRHCCTYICNNIALGNFIGMREAIRGAFGGPRCTRPICTRGRGRSFHQRPTRHSIAANPPFLPLPLSLTVHSPRRVGSWKTITGAKAIHLRTAELKRIVGEARSSSVQHSSGRDLISLSDARKSCLPCPK